jgi:hypothetical protein
MANCVYLVERRRPRFAARHRFRAPILNKLQPYVIELGSLDTRTPAQKSSQGSEGLINWLLRP